MYRKCTFGKPFPRHNTKQTLKTATSKPLNVKMVECEIFKFKSCKLFVLTATLSGQQSRATCAPVAISTVARQRNYVVAVAYSATKITAIATFVEWIDNIHNIRNFQRISKNCGKRWWEKIEKEKIKGILKFQQKLWNWAQMLVLLPQNQQPQKRSSTAICARNATSRNCAIFMIVLLDSKVAQFADIPAARMWSVIGPHSTKCR